MNRALLAAATLWMREMTRFFRQPSRLLGALGTPLVFWLFIGFGMGSSFQAGAVSYRDYFFPGTLLMILLFTAVFSTISIIEDRREGFLQSVLVAPIPISSLVLGKILGSATLAFIQGFLFLLLAPAIGIPMGLGSWIAASLVIYLNAAALTGLGFMVAWRMHSIQGFHAVMNLFLMPLWFLSGALFPQEGAPVWIRLIMVCNPLTYGLALLRRTLFGNQTGLSELPSFGFSLAATILFALATFFLSNVAARPRKAANL